MYASAVLTAAGSRMEPKPRVVRPALRPELHGEQRFLTATGEGATNEHFVMAHAIEVACVHQIDPGVERGMDRRDALLLIGWTVSTRHAHAPEGRTGMRPGRRHRGTAARLMMWPSTETLPRSDMHRAGCLGRSSLG